MPLGTDAGLLYYRSDRIAAVPDTWQGVYESARLNGGIVYQGQAYEGLTCDFLEIAFAAGGSVLSADGRRSAIDSPENLQALQFMVDGIRTGAAPSVVTVFDEYATVSAFLAGGPAYMRNWPYAYGFGQQTSLAGKFGVAPLPRFAGGGRAACSAVPTSPSLPTADIGAERARDRVSDLAGCTAVQRDATRSPPVIKASLRRPGRPAGAAVRGAAQAGGRKHQNASGDAQVRGASRQPST